MITERIKRTLQGSRARASTIQADEELLERLRAAIGSSESQLLRVRPPREHDGIENATTLLDAIHQIKNRGLLNRLGIGGRTHAFEMWYDEGKLQFYIRPETQADTNQFTRQLYSNYDDVSVEEVPQTFEASFPTLEMGDYIAGAEIKTSRQFWYPLKSNQPHNQELETDPYGSITSEMVVEEDIAECGERVGPEDYRMLVQVVFTPARKTWARGLPFGANVHEKAVDLKEDDPDSFYSPTSSDRKTAKIIEAQQGMPAFYTTIRIIGISQYEDIAKDRVGNAGEVFDLYDNHMTNQSLYPAYRGKSLPKFVEKAAERTHELSLRYRLSRRKQIMNKFELAGLVHLPTEEINTPMVDWSQMKSGPGVPADAEKVGKNNVGQGIEAQATHQSGQQQTGAAPEGQTRNMINTGPGFHEDPETPSDPVRQADRPTKGHQTKEATDTATRSGGHELPNPESQTDEHLPTAASEAYRSSDRPYPTIIKRVAVPTGHAYVALRKQTATSKTHDLSPDK